MGPGWSKQRPLVGGPPGDPEEGGAAWGSAFALPSNLQWNERRDLYPEGVASGDPDSSSVLLWTRHTPSTKNLTVEVAADESFRRVIATAPAPISAASDWTCRVLVGGLKPAQCVLVSLHRR